MSVSEPAAPVLYPALHYRDAPAAIDWLQRAFGFESILVVPDDDGGIAHAELGFAGGVLMLGSRHDPTATEPPYVYVADVDAHAAGARAAGATVVLEPEDKPYGGRGYACQDCEGHTWSFGSYRPRHARSDPPCHGVTPYLYYADAAAALNWLCGVLGCVEVARWIDPAGVIREVEVRAGEQPIWFAGMDAADLPYGDGKAGQLLILWTADVDAHYRRALAAGAEAEPPQDRPFGVRSYDLHDPAGYHWCVMQRLATPVQLEPGWRESRPS